MKKRLHYQKQVQKKKETTSKKSKTTRTQKNETFLLEKKSESITYPKKEKIYLSYISRVIFNILLAIFLLGDSLYFIGNSIFINPSKKISYTEKSNLDYRVYLKENDFYESEYLGKNMSYIASLIDYIDLSFDYEFNLDTLMDTNFDYKVIAVLNIDNETVTSNYFSKEYTLLEKYNQHIPDTKSLHIQEKVQLDYDYYNRLANHFKATYGVGTSSSLDIYLKINRSFTSEDIEEHELDGQSSMSIHIPLSQKAISIQLDYEEPKNQDSIISEGELQIKDMKLLIAGILCLGISILFFMEVYRKIKVLIAKNSNYDKYIKKILKEYDRLIVVTETMPNLENYQVFKLTDFNELLDVRDNTKKPIMYYNVADHIKCYFYLKDNTDIYLLCIKAVDMEKTK